MAFAIAKKIKDRIKQDWSSAPYYQLVEGDEGLRYFWSDGSPFPEMFEKLDTTRFVDLACGHGRHTVQILARRKTKEFWLVDINEPNIEHCRKRFAKDSRASFVVNAGNDLPGISDGSITAVISYDSMVHFEIDDVFYYLGEINRVLVPGGRALLHHSNNDRQPGNCYEQNVHWRNFMSAPMFAHFAIRQGLTVLEQKIIDWGGDDEGKGLDCVTLLEKQVTQG